MKAFGQSTLCKGGTRFVMPGSKKEHYDKYPNDLITWEVLKIFKKEWL